MPRQTHARILDLVDAADAVKAVEDFAFRLHTGRPLLVWPTIGAALLTNHPWLTITCEGCGAVTELDLRMKPRNLDAPITAALEDVRCPRCNGSGRPRVIGLAKHAS